MAKHYNFIYSQLVENENDFVGHIAYSLYKTDKIGFITDYKDTHNGKDPEEETFENFHRTACVKTNLERYKLHALVLLQSFLDDSLSTAKKQIEDECVKKHKEILSEVVSTMKPHSFWHGVLQSLVGALAFMILCAALLFCLTFSEKQYTFTIGGNGSVNVEAAKPTSTHVDSTFIDKQTP